MSPLTTSLLAAACGVVLALAADGRGLTRRLRRPTVVRAAIFTAVTPLLLTDVVLTVVDRTETVGAAPLHAIVLLAHLLAAGALLGLALSSRLVTRSSAAPRRVLAVGAHPDDLELACGGTLARLADRGHEVHALVLSHGGIGGRASARPDEAAAGGAFLGASDVEVHDFPDTRLRDHELELVAVIERAVQRFEPDVILTHSGNDQHQDHQAVHVATMRAARQHPAVLCYESPSATRAFSPTVFVDIEDYVEVKVAAVAAHRDQRGKPYMTPERVRSLAVYRGSQGKIMSAEAFEPVRIGSLGGVL